MQKNKRGDMTLLGLIIALVILLIFSPIFSYVYSRQSITESSSAIKVSLKSYSENAFNELYDEAKSAQQNNYIYSSLLNSTEFRNGLIKKVMNSAGFAEKISDDSKKYYSSKSGVNIYDPIIVISKDDSNIYHFKLLYDLKMPLSVIGINFYDYEKTYIAACDVNRETKSFLE